MLAAFYRLARQPSIATAQHPDHGLAERTGRSSPEHTPSWLCTSFLWSAARPAVPHPLRYHAVTGSDHRTGGEHTTGTPYL